MKKIIRSSERYLSDYGDIKSHFLFSFASYQDPNNMNWGDIRVFNDDFVGAGSGFPMHPHKHFEIMTIMLRGTLTHQDSLGNKETIREGQVQVTNTGRGISHSEFNEGKEDVLLYQIWFSPKKPIEEPSYYTAKFDINQFKDTLLTIASGIEPTENKLISEVSVKRGIFGKEKKIELAVNHTLLLYVTSGSLSVNGEILGEKDQLRASQEGILEIIFLEKSEILVIESL